MSPREDLPAPVMTDCPDCGLAHGGCPPADLLARARAFIADSEWTFAATMADNPHHYVVFPFADRGGTESQRKAWYALADLIGRYGWDRRWNGTYWRTLSLDGHDYWYARPVINRKPTASAGWEDGA